MSKERLGLPPKVILVVVVVSVMCLFADPFAVKANREVELIPEMAIAVQGITSGLFANPDHRVTPTPGPCTAPQWLPQVVYWGGDEVYHLHHQWRARWWTQGDEPGTTGPDGVWLDLGPCFGEPTPTPIPTVNPPPGWPVQVFAPYVDVLLYPSPSIISMYQATQQRYFTLAFIISNGECEPAWGGVISLEDAFYSEEINAIRGIGGDVVISFGGANGTELALACTDVETLVTAYQSVIDLYNLTWVDFDIEGIAVAHPESIERRNQAIRILQLNNPSLKTAFCLPVLPQGLTQDGLNVLTNALDHEVRIDLVNIMAMDYGSYAAPNPDGFMGEYAIQAAESLLQQLRGLYPTKPDPQLRAMIGITPMIGMNDVQNEIFYLDDAGQLLDYALTNHIGMLAMWSATRDHECPGGGSYVSPVCSGISQEDYDFINILKTFSLPLPTPTPNPSSVPTSNSYGITLLLIVVSAAILNRNRRSAGSSASHSIY